MYYTLSLGLRMVVDAMVGVVRLGDGWDVDDTLPHTCTHLCRASGALGECSINLYDQIIIYW